jgi:hypothetical protein
MIVPPFVNLRTAGIYTLHDNYLTDWLLGQLSYPVPVFPANVPM